MASPLRAVAALALSGPYAPFGSQAAAALRLWARQTNEGGGLRVAGRHLPIDLQIEDDGGDPRRTAALIEALCRRRPQILFGPYGSAAALAAAAVAARHRRLLWNHGGASDALHRGPSLWVLSLLSPASSYFVAAVEMVAGERRDTNRILAYRRAAGTFAAEVVWGAAVYARTQRFHVEERLLPATTGAAQSGAEAAQAEADLVLCAGRFEEDVAFTRAYREARGAATLAVVAAGVEAFGRRLGPLAEGVLGPCQWLPEAAPPEPDLGPPAGAFVAAYRAQSGETPDYPAAQAYAAGLIAARSLELAEGTRQSRLRSVAAALRCTTLFGPHAVDPESGRQLAHRPLTVRWQSGRRAPLPLRR